MKILRKIKLYLLLLSWPSLAEWASSIVWSFGLLWLIVEIMGFFGESWANDHIKPLWWFFLVAGIIIALIRNFPKTSFLCKIDDKDTSVEIRIESIFDAHETIIVGINTTFDTAMEDGTISPTSIQGKFTNEYCASVTELDQKLSVCLQNEPSKQLTLQEKPYGKMKRYPIGTVAKIDCHSRMAYFIAITHMGRDKKAYSSVQNIMDALPNLWAFVRSHGELEDICMPIIGSGYARIPTNKETLVREILRSFVAACSEEKLCGKFTLFIHPNDVRDGMINFDNTVDFLKHICTYENKRIGSQSIETSRSEIVEDNQHIKHIKATCFLLEEAKGPFDPRGNFKKIIENVAGTMEKAVPTLLEASTFKEFIEKSGKSLYVKDDPYFKSLKLLKNPAYKFISWSAVEPGLKTIKIWAIDPENNIYVNEIAKNVFNEEFKKLKKYIEQA